jgi:hypothetical protein
MEAPGDAFDRSKRRSGHAQVLPDKGCLGTGIGVHAIKRPVGDSTRHTDTRRSRALDPGMLRSQDCSDDGGCA